MIYIRCARIIRAPVINLPGSVHGQCMGLGCRVSAPFGNDFSRKFHAKPDPGAIEFLSVPSAQESRAQEVYLISIGTHKSLRERETSCRPPAPSVCHIARTVPYRSRSRHCRVYLFFHVFIGPPPLPSPPGIGMHT